MSKEGFTSTNSNSHSPSRLVFPRHVISASQFNKELLEIVLTKAAEMEKLVDQNGSSNIFSGKIMASMFYEESTRTRLSFEAAMIKLGGQVIGTENAKLFSSVAKGESLDDTMRIISGYADVIVLRHSEVGASLRASQMSEVPVINAGDGPGEHPTQALLDLYTIKKEFGEFDGKTIALVGDLLHGRTVRSLAHMLSHFENVKLILVAPQRLAMKADIKELLIERNIEFKETENLEEALHISDVVYMTRIQKERFESEEEYAKYKGFFILDKEKLKMMKKESIIMHPLPRVGEIAPEVDNDSRAKYFDQARNGLFVRMALICLVLKT